jgi:iron(III) transport system substrate-binding protein
MKRKLAIGAVLGLAMACAMALPAVAQKTELTIYTALENDQLAPFKQSIEAAVPDVSVVWVRDSTGVITARFLAEKDNPRADMVMGLAASSLLLFEKAWMLSSRPTATAPNLTPGPAWTPSSA